MVINPTLTCPCQLLKSHNIKRIISQSIGICIYSIYYSCEVRILSRSDSSICILETNNQTGKLKLKERQKTMSVVDFIKSLLLSAYGWPRQKGKKF